LAGVVAGAGAADMVTGNDEPLVAFVHQHVDDVARISHFGREKALRVVAQVAVAAPRLPPGLFEGLDFLAQNLFGEEGGEGVVVGEADEVQAARLPRLRCCRCSTAAVAEVPAAAELADVVDQRSGIAQCEAAAGKGVERVARAVLVGVLAVVDAEDVGQVVFGMIVRADAAVVLAGLEHDGIPGVLAALVCEPLEFHSGQ
jgi:hypothetical protein